MKKLFAMLLCLVVLAGCGSGSTVEDAVTSVLPVSATGTWVGDVTYTAYGSAKNVTLIMNQSGSNVSGIYIGDDGTQNISGTISLNKVQINLVAAGCEGSRSVTGAISLNLVTGKPEMSYSVTGGYICSGPSVNKGTGTLVKQNY